MSVFDTATQAIEAAHEELWRRFVSEQGVLLDYVSPAGEILTPSPEECAASQPNGMGWWSPIENGAFFSGLYLAGLCNRWAVRGKRVDDGQAARGVAAGLLLLARVGDAPGFIARGVATDGRSHHPAGSGDQTLPWFYGLWRYAKSGIPTEDEKGEVVEQMVAVASALERNGWRMPCDAASLGDLGCFAGKSPVSVPRLLFVTMALHELTGDPRWLALHEQQRAERPEGSDQTRLEICAHGALAEEYARPAAGYHAFWIKASSQACLRALRDGAHEREARRAYEAGLRRFARTAAIQVGRFRDFSADDAPAFDCNWRRLNEWWREQRTIDEAMAVAEEQARHWHGEISPRKSYEAHRVHEPLFAAWIVLLSDDRERIDGVLADIRGALCRYDWRRLYYSTFFAAECAYFEGAPYGI